MTDKILFTGKTRNTSGANGAARSSDGFLDIALPEPHPAAEQLFGAAWSACYMGALGLAALQRKVQLPADQSVDATIELVNRGGVDFYLRAQLDVSLPGLDRDLALELIDAAHAICPYSKAVHGNIAVETSLV